MIIIITLCCKVLSCKISLIFIANLILKSLFQNPSHLNHTSNSIFAILFILQFDAIPIFVKTFGEKYMVASVAPLICG